MQLDAISNVTALQVAAGGILELLWLPAASGDEGEPHMMFVAS